MQIIATRADEIIPGDKIASDVLGYFDTVTAVRYIERTTTEDEVEITTNSAAMSNTIRRRASRPVRVIV